MSFIIKKFWIVFIGLLIPVVSGADDFEFLRGTATGEAIGLSPAEVPRVPAAKPVEAPAVKEEEKSPEKDLDLEEAKVAFNGFGIGAVNDVSKRVVGVRLYGSIPSECIEKFTIKSTTSSGGSEIQSDHYIGFQIRDEGDGLSCVKRSKNKTNVIKLSKVAPILDLSLAEKDNYKIGLYRNDTQEDIQSDDERFQDLGKISYKSKETWDREAEAARTLEEVAKAAAEKAKTDAAITEQKAKDEKANAEKVAADKAKQETAEKEAKEKAAAANIKKVKEEAALKNQIQKWKKDLNTCNGSPEQAGLAREALSGLQGLVDANDIALDVMKEEERIEKKELEYELKEFERRAEKDSIEELEDLRTEVQDWIATHSDVKGLVDAVAKRIYVKIAQRLVQGNLAKNPANWERAKAVMLESLQIEGLSDVNRASIEKAISSDIPLAKQGAIASNGMAGNFLFWPNQMNLMNQLQYNAWAACSSVGQFAGASFNPFGGGATAQVGAETDSGMELCASAMTALQTAAAFPGQAQAVDQQRAQFAQQMRDAMMKAQGGGGQQGQGQQGQNFNGNAQATPQFQSQAPQSQTQSQPQNQWLPASQASGALQSTFISPVTGAPAYAGGIYGQLSR